MSGGSCTSSDATTPATRLRRAARDHDEAAGPFAVEADETADPVVQMRAAVLLAHAALRGDCWANT
ncbi:hypothetical protein ADL27_42965 [Streptomyces sp. NRRL F-6602]|nr:hypothetical protein ADL27_42965 [Streptomyces sp. NRRL F-6602]